MAKETLQAYKDEFKLGKRGFLDLLSSQSEYFNAKKSLISLEYDIKNLQYKLMFTNGVIDKIFKIDYNKLF